MSRKTDPRRVQEYLHLRWKVGLHRAAAAREAGIGEWKAKELDKGYQSGPEWREAREEAEVPGPIPHERLSGDALRALGDFEFFRLRYFGHVSQPWQVEAAERMVALLESPEDEYVVVNCPPGSGKALALDTPIPTPGGWTSMGEVRVGDVLFDERGEPCRVTYVSPVFVGSDCYEVSTDDGCSVVADGDHLWRVRIDGYRGPVVPYEGKTGPKPTCDPEGRTVRSTRFLAGRNPKAKRPHLEMPLPLQGPDVELPVDPYVLGVWLGDGDTRGARFTAHPDDAKWIRSCIEDAGYVTTDHAHPQRFGTLGLQRDLRRAGVLGNKHVPAAYLRASPTQRLALLQGLIDTDGHVGSTGHIEFCSTTEDLARAVQHLAHSLGAKAGIREATSTLNGRPCRTRWRVTFYLADAARLPRKRERCRDGVRTPGRYLTIRPVDSVPTRCIQVDSPSHLFLAGHGLLVTHNTTLFAHDIPAWLTCRNREIRGIIGSRTARQAEVYTARLRRTFERRQPVQAKAREKALGLAVDASSTLVMDFGRFKPDRSEVWTREAFIVAQIGDTMVSEKEPTWTAFGMDSGSLGWRVDYITWDDLVDKSTRTQEAEEAQQSWWDDEAETRLEPGGCLVLQGQRLRSTDLYRYCLNKRSYDDDGDETDQPIYRHIVFKAHYDEACDSDHGRDAKPHPEGCLLDPRRLGWKKLQQKRANGKFETVYQQQDVDARDVLVPKLWIDGGKGPDGTDHPGCWDRDRGLCELPKGLTHPILSVATADPSPTRFWAIAWWAYHPETEQRFLLDLVRQKMDAPDFLDWDYNNSRWHGLMEEWQLRSQDLGWPISKWVVEINAAQRFLLQYDHVRRWIGARKVDVIAHSTHRNKADEKRGVTTIAPHYQYGRIRLPGKGIARTASLKLVDEVTRWGDDYRGTDDCVMAHWFLEYNLPNLTSIDPETIPRLWRPSWMMAGAR